MEILGAVLLILALPAIAIVALLNVIAIVALVKTSNTRESLRQLQMRVAALEAGRPPGAAAAVIAPPPILTPPPPREAPATAAGEENPSTPGRVPAPLAVAPPTPAATWEEKFGTQWVVWIGGVALALGGTFLVRYSIEQGLIGPGARILLGALFAAILITAGEWARRNEITTGLAALPTRHIPSILTAAGTVAAYATVYAAFALYNFLSPAAAFVLLGLVALATLVAALLHGPALAGLGIAGAFITPVLVHTGEPHYWALYLYIAVVTGAALALARLRLWPWLAVTAVVLGTLWTLPGINYPHVDALAAHLFHVIAGFALAAALIVCGLLYGPESARGQIDKISSGAIAAYLFATTFIVVGSFHDPAALIVFTILTAATVAIAWRTDAALWALPAAGIMTAIVMLHWAAPRKLVLPDGLIHGAIPEPSTAWHLTLGAALAALFGLVGYAAQGRSETGRISLIWSATAVATPVAILIALYARIAEFDQSIPFAGIALVLAALFGYAADRLNKRAPRPGIASAVAIFATGAVAALALALTFALYKGWLTIGLALMVPGIAWISERRPLPALRYLAAAMIALVLLRVIYEPRIVGDNVGTTPLFNWLLYGYGVPAASFWYAGFLLRKRADDIPARIAEAAAILFTVLLTFFEIRHTMNNGEVFVQSTALAEVALQISTGLALTIGLEWLRVRSHSIVHDIGALIVGALTLAAIVLGPMLLLNPMSTGRPVGNGLFFNLILLGYGIPAVLAAILALVARASRPLAYRTIAAAIAVALALSYFSLEIRALYHGPVLWRSATSDVEQYTYSAVWLLFGVILLIAGLLLRSQPARLASAAVMTITIAKVFFIDMAGLTGIFRALSFIGLGAVLVGIGWLYQRLLFPRYARVPQDDGQSRR